MALSFKAKKRLIIGGFASVAATWSGATACIPVVGPVLADTAGLTVLTTAMAYSLSILYNKQIGIASLAAFASVAVGAALGQLALKAGASLIPIFGSYFNASVTFVLHAATGWALCEIFDSGRNLESISSEEIRMIIRRNREKAKEEKARFDSAMNQLSSTDREEVKRLMKQMDNKELSEYQHTEIMNKIIAIFERNGIDSPFED